MAIALLPTSVTVWGSTNLFLFDIGLFRTVLNISVFEKNVDIVKYIGILKNMDISNGLHQVLNKDMLNN